MKNNKKTGGSKRAAIEKATKIAKSAGSALVTGATASGVAAATMLTGKILIEIGPFVIKTVGKLSIPKLIITGVSTAAGVGLTHYVVQTAIKPLAQTKLLTNKSDLTDEASFAFDDYSYD